MKAKSAGSAATYKWRRLVLPLLVLALGLLLPSIMNLIGSTTFIATEILIFAIFAVGFNLLIGYTGILSFGHAAWFGMASYSCALFQIHFAPNSILLPMLFAMLFTTLAGLLIGRLIIKTRGIYFAYVTIAFGQLMFYIVFRWTALTGGENGMGGIKRVPLLRLINLAPELNFYFFVLALFVLLFLLMRMIVDSPLGHVLKAIRENRTRAIFVGYDVKAYEFASYVISVFYASVAGSLYAYLVKYVFPESLHWSVSGEVVIMTLVGGMHYLFGPVIGAFIVTFLKDFISSYTDRWMIVLGAIFVFFVLASPEGVLGFFLQRKRKRAPAFMRKKGKENPA
jgi:ABC-type branched-subunit amino acid transport system permease subunit